MTMTMMRMKSHHPKPDPCWWWTVGSDKEEALRGNDGKTTQGIDQHLLLVLA